VAEKPAAPLKSRVKTQAKLRRQVTADMDVKILAGAATYQCGHMPAGTRTPTCSDQRNSALTPLRLDAATGVLSVEKST
jgi:hypothetical protein